MVKILPIFLSAGMGTRLNHSQPKCLIELNDVPLIVRSIFALKYFNFDEIVIVVGYEKESIKNKLGSEISGIKIHYIDNEKFYETGTAYSFYLTKEIAQNKNLDVMMIHGDVFFDKKIFFQEINFNESNVFLDSNFSMKTNDEMVVFGKKSHVSSIEKGPNKEILKLHEREILGESLGINIFKVNILENLFENLKKSIEINKKIHWEQTIKSLTSNFDIKLNFVDIAPINWVNINYKDDLELVSKFDMD